MVFQFLTRNLVVAVSLSFDLKIGHQKRPPLATSNASVSAGSHVSTCCISIVFPVVVLAPLPMFGEVRAAILTVRRIAENRNGRHLVIIMVKVDSY